MDQSYYDDMNSRLLALLAELQDRLAPAAVEHAHDYLNHNELGLALETITDSMCDRVAPVSIEERSRILDLAGIMKLGDRVESSLRLCPDPAGAAWFPGDEWRPVLANESALLNLLLSQKFPGARELRLQLTGLQAQQGCGCGCGTVNLRVDTSLEAAPVTKQPVQGEADVRDQHGNWGGGLILFARRGYLSCLEIVNFTDDPWPLPKPEQIRLRVNP